MARRNFKPLLDDFGYIYVAKAEGIRGYKIGKTTNWKQRIADIAGQLPVTVEYEYVFKSPDIHFGEAALHKHFDLKRLRGEWFDLDTDDLTSIEEVYAEHEANVVVAVNRRIPDRAIKDGKKRPHKELAPIDTCPVCNKIFRRHRANYMCCSYECFMALKDKRGYGILPSWIWVQAGGVPPWAYTDGIAPHMNFTRDADNLAWEYHRLVDRD